MKTKKYIKNSLDWYKGAAEVLEFYQQEELREEQRKWENKRKPILEELKKELSEINASEYKESAGYAGLRKFLKFVYEKYPPKHKVCRQT